MSITTADLEVYVASTELRAAVATCKAFCDESKWAGDADVLARAFANSGARVELCMAVFEAFRFYTDVATWLEQGFLTEADVERLVPKTYRDNNVAAGIMCMAVIPAMCAPHTPMKAQHIERITSALRYWTALLQRLN